MRVDAKRCRRCGLCLAVCPELFYRTNDGEVHARYLPTCGDGSAIAYARYAAEDCPAGAISVYEDEPVAGAWYEQWEALSQDRAPPGRQTQEPVCGPADGDDGLRAA